MRKIAIFLFACLLSKYSLSQAGNKNLNVIPQTPNAAALFKSTETPVSYYNGTTGLSIPVYEISAGSTKIPITLSYASGGIKVSEEASWVGLGWNLNAGGTISQNVVGKRDENISGGGLSIPDYMKHNIIPNAPLGRNNLPMNVIERGICFPDTNGTVRKYGYLDNSDNQSLGTNESFYETLSMSNREYDLYMYNLNGQSGKFINPKINYYGDRYVSLDNNNIRFAKTGSFFSSGDLTATTPDGTVYLFNNLETITPVTDQSNPTYNRHLTSITTPEGRVINFIYKTVSTTFMPSASHSLTYKPVNDVQNGYGAFYIKQDDVRTINENATSQALYLDSIKWDNGTIVFTTNTRNDMVGGARLTGIRVLNKSNVVIKQIDFTYDYFTGNVIYGDYLNQTQGNFQPPAGVSVSTIPESVRQKRLKLLSVKIDDAPAYTFDYSTVDMPYKTAFARDIWDYFNGAHFDNLASSSLNSLLVNPQDIGYYDPSISIALYSGSNQLPFGKRYPSADYMETGILKKITYPTGGYTTYEYEPNKFSAPDNVSVTIQPISKYARDGNNSTLDHQQETFTVPTVNSSSTTNPGKISVRLSCNCSNSSGSTLCVPYIPGSSYNLDDGLYILMEIWNTTTSQWNLVDKWDFSKPDLISNNTYTIGYNFLQEKQYRITANYPDRSECATGDLYSNRAAEIQVTYYAPITNTISYPNIGGGIRIKRITDYNVDGQIAIQRELSYEGGKLLTKPVFHRLVTWTPFTKRANSALTSHPCSACDFLGDAASMALPGTGIDISERFESGFFSQPSIPYSYGANGSLVGYDKVTLEYKGPNGNNGKTEFEYNNNRDIILNDYQASFFSDFQLYNHSNNLEASLLPGIPGIKDPLNGMIKTQTEFERKEENYNTIRKTSYTYDIANKKIYWAFKVESGGMSAIMAIGMGQGCGLTPGSDAFFQCNDALRNYVYFYPVQSCNVNLATKTEQQFDGNTQAETVTSYTYNSKNQLFKEVSTDSKNNQLSKETTFIWESSTPASSVKTEMMNRNMLDYPVEQTSKNLTQSKELAKSKTSYQFYNGTSLILPDTIKTSSGGNSLETDVVFNSYDSKGNPLQYIQKDGVPVCYVWAYTQTYPVAKVVGAKYSDVLQALGQSDPNLAYLQSMSDASLETELNKIRNNLRTTIPAAQVNLYLYNPLVGIKQATDPNGRKMFYEYDSSGRLVLIKDKDGNVIKTFEYQYRQSQ